MLMLDSQNFQSEFQQYFVEQKKAPWRSRGFLIGKLLGLDWGLRASAIARAILEDPP
jgi:hypothetical protein